ncbi:MAG: tetratricopeptide repeat protein [Candidatus Margulisiibacteriota bacterium]
MSNFFENIFGSEKAPTTAAEVYAKGVELLNKRKYKQSLTYFTRFIELEPDSPKGYFNRALCYRQMGKIEEALADHDRSIELAPANASAYYNRAIAYYSVHRLDEALKDYTKVLELKPRDGGAYYSRALVYFLKKEYENSLNDANTAASLGYIVDSDFLDKLHKHLSR